VPIEGGAGEWRLGHHGVDGQLAERVMTKELHSRVADLPTGFFTLDAPLCPLPRATRGQSRQSS
jgi:hypothetical protein